MNARRFHRLAVLADVTPEELSRVLRGADPRENIVRRVAWALCVIRADDVRRGREAMQYPRAVSLVVKEAEAA